MIVQLIDSNAGTPVYVNSAYVVTLRPDPRHVAELTRIRRRRTAARRCRRCFPGSLRRTS